jgi:ABC-type transport system involved in multi-copper enzyme maturation permease subunit
LFRVVIALARYEIRHTLRPQQISLLLGLCLLLAYEEVSGPKGPAYAQVQGALTIHGSWLRLAAHLLAGVAGGSLAGEQKNGVTSILLARGIPRGQYLLSRILGAAGSAALLTAAAVAGFYVIVAIRWPAGQVTFGRDGAYIMGPIQALFAVHPLANDLVMAAMSVVAAAGMSTWSVLAGTLTTNRYVAMLAPLLLFILSAVVHEYGVHRWLNPYTYVDLPTYYRVTFSAAWQPYAAFLYWSCVAALVAALARWIFLKKELT